MTPPVAVTDDVLARARAGDADAFGVVYEAHAGRVHALCLRLSADAADARELTQDVFVRVWRTLASFRGDSALGTWIHRVAVSVVLERQRAEARRTARVEPVPSMDALRPIARRDAVDERMDLERAIAALTPAARTVFVLHEMEGYDHAEISRLTGTTETALRAQLYRARRQLMETLRA